MLVLKDMLYIKIEKDVSDKQGFDFCMICTLELLRVKNPNNSNS